MFFLKPSGLRYIQRINPTIEDFTINDFTWDGEIHTLDLSGIVPANAKMVDILVDIRSDEESNYLMFFPANSTHYWDGIKVRTQSALNSNSNVLRVVLSTPQTIQYKAKIYTGIITILEVIVLGWYI